MKEVFSVYDLPNVPAVYAMFGGRETKYVSYVGLADNLKRRIIQHLVTRDSSIATRTSAVGLNPDYVTEVKWWEHPKFTDRNFLIASELMAFDVLQLALRSRGTTQEAAKQLY